MKIKVLIALLIAVFTSYAQTNVSGPSFTDVTWDETGSPYNIVGNFQIPSGVTLTIKENVVVNFTTYSEILIKGSINIDGGQEAKSIVFNGYTSNPLNDTPMIMFKGTNLSTSTIKSVIFNGPQKAFQLAEESEHNQDPVKNSGTLNIQNVKLLNTIAATKGYDTNAKLTISDSEIDNSTVVGYYPRTEEIDLSNCNISNNSIIRSDAYNKGITIINGVINNSSFKVECCGSNLKFEGTTINNSKAISTSNYNSFDFKNCNITELNFKNYDSYGYLISSFNDTQVNFDNCIINNSNSEILMGGGIISKSKIYGNGNNTGIEFTSHYSNSSIANSEISGFDKGIKFSKDLNISISDCNIYNNTSWNVYNTSKKDIPTSNVYWGMTNTSEIRTKIYDFYKDIELGEVKLSSVSSSMHETSTLSNKIISKFNNVSFSPNPIVDYLSFELNSNEIINYKIITETGKEVSTGIISASNTEINFSHLSSGVYFIILNNGNNTESHKLIKI